MALDLLRRDGYAESRDYGEHRRIAAVAIFSAMLIVFLAVTTYLTAGYCQAKKRAKKGLTPTRHDGYFLRTSPGVHPRPRLQNDFSFYRATDNENQDLEGGPPPVYDANNAPPPIYQPPAAGKDNTVPEYTAAPSHSSSNQNISQDRQNAATLGASPATARTIRSPWISRLLPRK